MKSNSAKGRTNINHAIGCAINWSILWPKSYPLTTLRSLHSTIESCRNHIQQGVPETPLLIEHFILLYLMCFVHQNLTVRNLKTIYSQVGRDDGRCEMCSVSGLVPPKSWDEDQPPWQEPHWPSTLWIFLHGILQHTQINILNHINGPLPHVGFAPVILPRHIIRQCKIFLKPCWIRSDQKFLLLQVNVFTRPCTTGRWIR